MHGKWVFFQGHSLRVQFNVPWRSCSLSNRPEMIQSQWRCSTIKLNFYQIGKISLEREVSSVIETSQDVFSLPISFIGPRGLCRIVQKMTAFHSALRTKY